MNENIPSKSPFPFIQNINRDLRLEHQQKALISYITDPFQKNIDGKSFHTNQKEAVQLLQVFIANNFAVDICHCREEQALPEITAKQYDVVFGFGKPFMEACKANPRATRIIYCTEAYPDFVKQQEQQRIKYYQERYGKEIKVSRHGKFYLPEHYERAEYLLFKGNNVTGKTFSGLKNIKEFLPIAPAPFVNTNYAFTEREVTKTKNNFVWFGSFGAVHKGLDLLIDIFNQHLDWQLSVCGLWKEEISLLPAMGSNIIVHGFMDTASEEFIELVNTHSFVVLPTCSEGMSSGVLTCMVHGLIPLVSRESGIDLDNQEHYLEDYHLAPLENKLNQWANMDEQNLKEMHRETFHNSRLKYNLKVFTETFDKHLQKCLNK